MSAELATGLFAGALTITAKTDSQVPIISYVSAYPIALIVMIIISKVLIKLIT